MESPTGRLHLPWSRDGLVWSAWLNLSSRLNNKADDSTNVLSVTIRSVTAKLAELLRRSSSWHGVFYNSCRSQNTSSQKCSCSASVHMPTAFELDLGETDVAGRQSRFAFPTERSFNFSLKTLLRTARELFLSHRPEKRPKHTSHWSSVTKKT